ncbi:MAG: peptide chain release factor 3 [Spirochaetia bacterium]
MTELQKEISQRLTFAIISHPDAGKTTITEKLLLFGGQIHTAGAVKSKKNSRKTISDFMEMERERGISISTSVMGFLYNNRKINLLDTPGHADFSEDTYRTLTAVDSALMVIDSVKGVEERTRKLCEICRMRDTPIITFMNKLDREGKDPIELLDELEEELQITACPMSWPVGQGQRFRGVYSLYEKQLILFHAHQTQEAEDAVIIEDLDDPLLDQKCGSAADALREEVALVSEVYPKFNKEDYLSGKITPVFFGSAVNNFGVRELLDCFVDIAPPPVPRPAENRKVSPDEEAFTGLIFKIHANLDPRHRDRIAFLRICSGRFERNKRYLHVQTGKGFQTANPTAFMAQERNIIDIAYPGDIIGIHDTGSLKIGDSLSEGEDVRFTGIPRFAPQIFKKVVNKDPLKSKQLNKGLQQLSEEGVAQVFTKILSREKLIGVVGALQFEVIQHRLEHEYKAKCIFEGMDVSAACWITSKDKKKLNEFIKYNEHKLAQDKDGKYVLLAHNQWIINRLQEENPDLIFQFTSDE